MTTATPTLSIDRVAQAQISSTVTTLLSTAATARRANIPLNNVVAAGFSQQAALITQVAAKVAESKTFTSTANNVTNQLIRSSGEIILLLNQCIVG